MSTKRESKYTLLRKIKTFQDSALKVICTNTTFKAAKPIFHEMMRVLSTTNGGVGLAANQIGYTKRIIVIRPNGINMLVLINPVITIVIGSPRLERVEGCLSYPYRFKKVVRSKIIDVSYINESGSWVGDTFENLNARIIQHEVDHLNGECVLARKEK